MKAYVHTIVRKPSIKNTNITQLICTEQFESTKVVCVEQVMWEVCTMFSDTFKNETNNKRRKCTQINRTPRDVLKLGDRRQTIFINFPLGDINMYRHIILAVGVQEYGSIQSLRCDNSEVSWQGDYPILPNQSPPSVGRYEVLAKESCSHFPPGVYSQRQYKLLKFIFRVGHGDG